MNWTRGFSKTLTIRLKPEDLAAFERAAADDMRGVQEWMRLVLRRAANSYYPQNERPPMTRALR